MMNMQPGSDKPTDIACLLLPLFDRQLVLPNETVVEIVSSQGVERVEGKASWFLGQLPWRDQIIPVISFERLNGEGVENAWVKGHIAVLNSISQESKLPFFGILIQDIPRLIRLAKEEVAHDVSAEPALMEQMIVSVIGESACIPHLEKIEQSLLEALE